MHLNSRYQVFIIFLQIIVKIYDKYENTIKNSNH